MAIEKLHLKEIAKMAKVCQHPRREWNVLDNTMIVYVLLLWGPPLGHDWPLLLLGGMDKKLQTGRYIEYPKYGSKGHRTVGNLLSLM